jgi:hypothetical protein
MPLSTTPTGSYVLRVQFFISNDIEISLQFLLLSLFTINFLVEPNLKLVYGLVLQVLQKIKPPFIIVTFAKKLNVGIVYFFKIFVINSRIMVFNNLGT